ncbi:MAG: 30S ribosomal protein S4e [Candidatus Thermoplasmatota archaeon]
MSKHLKRLVMPRTWPLPRKIVHWAPMPSPGPHPMQRSMPLYMVVRDMIELCDTAREAKRIIGMREVLVDRRVASDPKLPVGLMDVLSIPKTMVHFRVMLNRLGRFALVRIEEESAGWKLCRVERKTIVKGGKTQLGLHDGRCILTEGKRFKTGDVLKIQLPSQKILGHYPLAKGNMAMLIGGSHIGELHEIEGYLVTANPKANMVSFKDGLSTVKEHVFVVGKGSPEVKMPEVSVL